MFHYLQSWNCAMYRLVSQSDLVLAMVLMIHLSVELVKEEVSRMQNTLRNSVLAIALVQVQSDNFLWCGMGVELDVDTSHNITISAITPSEFKIGSKLCCIEQRLAVCIVTSSAVCCLFLSDDWPANHCSYIGWVEHCLKSRPPIYHIPM